MDREEILLQEFLASRLREKGFSLKRLSETTGIAPAHLENLLRGNFADMPSAPYFRGYLIRLGKVLDFDGEEWWTRIKRSGAPKNSGPTDALPQNRFMKRGTPKVVWLTGIAATLLIIYLVFEFSRIVGRPTLTVTTPPETPYSTTSNTLMLTGVVRGADTLYLSNGTASSSEEIMIAVDGTWAKSVLLQNGPNTFVITAKKFLGSETTLTEEIIYQPAIGPSTSTASTTLNYPAIHSVPSVPATGTFFE